MVSATTLEWGAAACTLEGGPFVPEGERPNVYLAAASSDAVYVYHRPIGEGVHRIEKWSLNLADGGCTLTRDASFAGDGQLERPGIVGMLGVVGSYLIVADRLDTVYNLDGSDAFTCTDLRNRSRIAQIDATPTQALVTYGTTGVERWTFADGACSSEPLWPLPASHQVSYYFDEIDGEVAGLYLLPEQQTTIARFAADGSERWRFGANRDGAADYRIGNVMSVAEVGGQLLVLDTGVGQVLALSGEGVEVARLATASAASLFGASVSFDHVIAIADDVALVYASYSEGSVRRGGFIRLNVR
jgi:hypothetical protein